MTDPRAALLARIDGERESLIELLRAFVRIDTANPPGDTRTGADFLCRWLDGAGLAWRIVAPRPEMPNIVAAFDCGTPGRHLVLNGHIDVFPAGTAAAWSRDPWGAQLSDGRIYGRGTADMKCGTVASLITYALLHPLRDRLCGRLTLTLVSDEETGGRWGSGYLVEHHGGEVLGDCVLNGEPSSIHTVRFGEKSIYWLKFRVRTPGAHSAYPHLSASATRIAAQLIRDLERLEQLEPAAPESVRRVLSRPEVRAAIDRGLGRGAADIVQRLTVNIGTLHGGVKVNMLPDRCELEVDMRLPVGLTVAEVRREVEAILRNYPEVSVEEPGFEPIDPNWCDPEGEMLRLIQKNARELGGIEPLPIVNLGGTDCRFWRARGVPAYVYGCSPDRMGAPDESVAIDEFLHIVRTHALSAYDYLSAAGAG